MYKILVNESLGISFTSVTAKITIFTDYFIIYEKL